MKESLFGKTLKELQTVAAELYLPAYSAKQMAEWMYKKNIQSIDEMTNLSKKNRETLQSKYTFGTSPFANVQISSDGTKKYLFSSSQDQFIEAAFIPDSERATLCISSQVGCKMGCLFCMTGKQGFQGNLTSGEIVNQVKSLPENNMLTNIVFMGMGEPLDNLDNVLKATEILTAGYGWAWSPKRITVSTIGIIPAMKEFMEKSNCHLAVSLHSPFHEERLELMPVESVYPAEEVVDVLKSYDIGRQRRISFEYIMFKGVNDTPNHVKKLTKLLQGLKCRINLIRFHPIPDTPLQGSDDKTIFRFKDDLNSKGILTTVRASRGQDISAACGLLSTRNYMKKVQKDY
jgi:23S rRNA (adenine2503-C2)-methyltransferase